MAWDRTAELLRRIAVTLGIARARLPMAAALAMAFGLMMVVALASVLTLAFSAGTANTRQLLADKTNLLLDRLEERVEALLEPVGVELRIIAGFMGAGEIDPTRMQSRQSMLHGMLAAAPQIVGVLFVTPDLKAYRFLQEGGPLPVEDWSRVETIRDTMARARADALAWGPPAWSEELDETVINAHLAVERDGGRLGVLFAAVTLDTVVSYVNEISAALGQPVFVLQGRDRVVALPGLDTDLAGPGRPLPLLAEAGNPVLAAMWAEADQPLGTLGDGLRGELRRVEAGGDDWILFYRAIPGFGDQPWIVGTYLPASIAGTELRRLRWALALSLGCLLLAVAATFWMGRRMARPVANLAAAAQGIQALELDRVQDLPRSHIAELDRAARAFNAMRNGLAWFETYVPRRLVRQLMDNPSPDAVRSREIEVTVLFTDIVGFSSLAEQLDAQAAADLLNRHFELLAGCVGETDGTVDKFLGDGMMAFWGAPLPQDDHAVRAVRAALLIRDRLRAEADFPALRLRAGLHTGPALVGNIGARDRLNYTLVGDTVNVTQRLEQLGKEVAPEDDIVIVASATTATHARGLCTVQPLGAWQLRGRDETVEAFRLR